MTVRIAAWTHVGRVRHINEDVVALPGAILTGSPPVPIVMDLPPGHTHDSLVVAVLDGLGGHAGGQVAARSAALHLSNPSTDIDRTLRDANHDLFAEMVRRPELRAMGSTVAGIRFVDRRVEVFNVGDSRVYRLADELASLLTVDDRGPGSTHQLTRSLGGTPRPEEIHVHQAHAALDEPARFLLCTDGLHDYVAFSDIQDRLRTGAAVEVVGELVELALGAGAPDNVSVVVVDVGVDDR